MAAVVGLMTLAGRLLPDESATVPPSIASKSYWASRLSAGLGAAKAAGWTNAALASVTATARHVALAETANSRVLVCVADFSVARLAHFLMGMSGD